MGCCASNTASVEERKKNEKGSGAPMSPSKMPKIEEKNFEMKEALNPFKPFIFDRSNNTFLKNVDIVSKIIEDTPGFLGQFNVLKESISPEGFDENLEVLLQEFNEILTFTNITKEEFSEVSKFLIAENHILQKRLLNYQLWNVPEIIITTYRDYIKKRKKRFNKGHDDTHNLEKIFRNNKSIFPIKQNGPFYETRSVPKGLPFDYSDINKNFHFNSKFNEMQVANFMLQQQDFTNEKLMKEIAEFIKDAQNISTVAIILLFEKDDVDGIDFDIMQHIIVLLDAISNNENVNAFMFCNANKVLYRFSDIFMENMCNIISKPNLFACHLSCVNIDQRIIKSLELSKVVMFGVNANDVDDDIFVDKFVKTLSSNRKLEALYLSGFNLTDKQLEVIKKMMFTNPKFKAFEYLEESDI